jgi:hypothetical protein
MRLFLLIVLWLSLTADFSVASQVHCERSLASVSDHYENLAHTNQLIHQMDPRLILRDLVIPRGGLCGTTCAVNALHAVARYLNRDTSGSFAGYSDEFLHEMVLAIFERFRHDSRQGVFAPQLIYGIERKAYELRLPVWASAQYSSTSADLVSAENELIVAIVNIGLNPEGGPTAHALVITRADPIQGLVTYSDPNYPNQLKTSRLWTESDAQGNVRARIQLSVPFPTELSGTVTALIRIRSDIPMSRIRTPSN